MAMLHRSILRHVLRTATALAVLVAALMPPTRLSKLENVCSGSDSVRRDVKSPSNRVSAASFSSRLIRVKAVRSESEEKQSETARPTCCPIYIPPDIPPKPERDLATPGLDRSTYPMRC